MTSKSLSTTTSRTSRRIASENPFSGFWLMPEEDRRYWTVRIKRAGARDHYLTLNYDNWEPWEVQRVRHGVRGANDLHALRTGVRPAAFRVLLKGRACELDPRSTSSVGTTATAATSRSIRSRAPCDIALDEALELNGDVTYGADDEARPGVPPVRDRARQRVRRRSGREKPQVVRQLDSGRGRQRADPG